MGRKKERWEGEGVGEGDEAFHPSALSSLSICVFSLTLSHPVLQRVWECVGKEGPGPLPSPEWISLCFWGSQSVPLSWCHCNSRQLTYNPYGFMEAHHSPPPQLPGQIATGCPPGGTQSICILPPKISFWFLCFIMIYLKLFVILDIHLHKWHLNMAFYHVPSFSLPPTYIVFQ